MHFNLYMWTRLSVSWLCTRVSISTTDAVLLGNSRFLGSCLWPSG